MAGPGTVSVLAHRAALVFSRYIVIGMTSGAIRTVRRCCPSGGLGIVLVAGGAKQVATVITRVFSGGMPEINGQPPGRVVAGITLQTGAEMIAGFTRCLCTVMAGGTGTGDAIVIKTGGYPCLCGMAVVALCVGLYMIGRFAGRGTAIMAGGTGARSYATMIENGGYPGNAGMTVVAGIATGDVRGMFTGCRRAVVAG